MNGENEGEYFCGMKKTEAADARLLKGCGSGRFGRQQTAFALK